MIRRSLDDKGTAVYALFDFDGPLTDSREGIVASIKHALNVLCRPIPADGDLIGLTGSPLRYLFCVLLSIASMRFGGFVAATGFEPIGMKASRAATGRPEENDALGMSQGASTIRRGYPWQHASAQS